MSSVKYPTVEYVRQCLRYDDGKLFWLPRPREHFKTARSYSGFISRRQGSEAGHLNTFASKQQRHVIVLDKKHYMRYTLVWAICKGEWITPIDHINRLSMDDRIENLRPATQSQNLANMRKPVHNKSGFKGVSWDKVKKKWLAQITLDKKRTFIGRYSTPLEAHEAYMTVAADYYGEFACHG